MSRLDPLARPDKWYLSAGDGFLWAPPFPEWLHRPGYWDEAHYFQHALRPLYSVALVAHDGREIPLEPAGRRWWPGRLVARWETPVGTTWQEERFLLPGGLYCSAWRGPAAGTRGGGRGGEHLVAFTMQPGPETRGVAAEDGWLRWERTLRDRHGAELGVECALGLLDPPEGGDARKPRRAAVRAQGSPVRPEWRLTPFRETWGTGEPREGAASGSRVSPPFAGGLRSGVRLEGLDDEGLVHLAVQPLRVPSSGAETGAPPSGRGRGASAPADRSELTFAFRFAPSDPGLCPGPEPIPAHELRSVGIGAGEVAGGEPGEEPPGGGRPPGPGTRRVAPAPSRRARRWWEASFARYPTFSCSDEHLERYFDYRVYGLLLNGLGGGAGNVVHPAVAEGIDYFHVPIAYSAPCHALETRWSAEPARARGAILNFLENQRADGSLHGRIYPDHLEGTDFYHANWGDAALAVEAVHPDPGFRERAYRGLARYAAWLDRERDPGATGMYDVRNHYETGQEYMSRYTAVDPAADRRGWDGGFRLKGIDVTTYAYLLKRALARLAAATGRPGEAREWSAGADAVGAAVTGRMWDPEAGFFTDVDPATGEPTGVKAAVGFYPLLTDLPSPDRVDRLLARLRDPETFATPVPVPSTSRDDPLFSAEAEWKGKRHACPWNGRVWPMTNSHVVEGLLRQWHAGRREAGRVAAELLGTFVRTMFHDGDPGRPNCYEHYNPLTGHPSEYRGVDDYQHSWVLDLLVRGVAGLEPQGATLRIDPLPLELERVELAGCAVRGREVHVRRRGRRVEVEVDGEARATEVGEPLEIEL